MSGTAPTPNNAENSRLQLSAEDAFLDLLIETLQNLEQPVRAKFLQKFLKALAQVELSEATSLEFWDQILTRRRELSETLAKPVSLQTAIVDVLASSNFLRMPILMEYEDLKKLQINAATDALTGLYNRRLFEEYFAKELYRAKRHNQHVALVIMDLHCFKAVNDRHGHMQGDHMLQLAASTLRKTLRTSDYAFRIGGDEFALLLPFADPVQAATLGRRVRANYATAIAPLNLDIPLALDFGVAVFPNDGEAKDALIRLADERLYELKNSTRTPSAPPPASSARVIPMEPPASREAPASMHAPPAPAFVHPAAQPTPFPPAARTAERRKWERVSLVGTRAHAVIGEGSEVTARVLDMSYGGVALLLDQADKLPNVFPAVLHVPILPPVKVSLRKAYVEPAEGNKFRVGCAFLP
ncbi:MAG TPA: diguanylate cyclase [Patescibacteria group bacterium]|nr:diguanylate cyclase [Patescibacteria group bacterium]